MPDEFSVEVFGKPTSGRFEVRSGIVAKDEPNARRIPSVEILGQREVGVAAQKDVLEPPASAQCNGAVEDLGGTVVRRAVSGAVDDVQRLVRVRERYQQGVITPHPLVAIEVHPLLALRVRGNDRTVGINACDLVRQRRASPFPHPDSRFVDRLHQAPDVELPKPTAEIPGRRGVRDRSSTERVQVREVVATQLDVVEGPPAAHHVVGNVQDVLGLKVGSVMLEQREVLVDALTEPDAIDEMVHRTDSAC